VIYTSAEETADERIERLVYLLRDRFREITVASSDVAEQQVSFGGGALRVSADGLLRRLETVERKIQARIRELPGTSAALMKDRISQEIMNILEKWRRS
jgi:predicted RNA-binding protein with PIN domain